MYHALTEFDPASAGRQFDLAKIAARLRVAVSGGAPMPAETMRRFEDKFNVPVLEGYGLSETSPIATFNRVDRPRKPGSIGLPVSGRRGRDPHQGQDPSQELASQARS